MSVGLARGYALAGHRDQAQQSLRELQTRGMHHYVSPYGLAQVYAALGDKSAALDMLDRALNEHAFEVLFLSIDRSFDSLHENPRFKELLKRVRFPQQSNPWQAAATGGRWRNPHSPGITLGFRPTPLSRPRFIIERFGREF
jgi:hypothetical protein